MSAITARRKSAEATLERSHPHGFDLLRILAAALVLLGHSFLLPTTREPVVLAYSDYKFDFGRVGVLVFFAISGYLIYGSWMREPSLERFALKRARRIYPALALMILITAFVIGPISTHAPGYLTNPQTATYLVRNALVIPYQKTLPGVFANNPVPQVNGVLWSLSLEVCAYILVATTGAVGLLRRPAAPILAACFFTLVGWETFAVHLFPHAALPLTPFLSMLACFFWGASIRALRRRVPWHLATAAAAAIAVTAVLHAPLSLIVPGASALLVVYLGTRQWVWARRVTRLGDPSYGAYIWGFVLQQVLIAVGFGTLARPEFVLASLVAGLGAGYLSWHLVERRALHWERLPTFAPPIVSRSRSWIVSRSRS